MREVIIEKPLEFLLEGLFDDPIHAIRAFYTAPIDAVLVGPFLLRKDAGRPDTVPNPSQQKSQ